MNAFQIDRVIERLNDGPLTNTLERHAVIVLGILRQADHVLFDRLYVALEQSRDRSCDDQTVSLALPGRDGLRNEGRPAGDALF